MTESHQDGAELEQAIADHLANWERAHVELAIYGTDDPSRIARAITDFCSHHLDADIDRAIFYQSSIGAVAGLSLRDGRRVVLKAHQPDVPHAQLEEIVSLRTEITRVGGPSHAAHLLCLSRSRDFLTLSLPVRTRRAPPAWTSTVEGVIHAVGWYPIRA